MKLAYIANTGLAEGWAHSVQIMNMCKAFSDAGVDVTLIVPNRSLITDDPFEYYKILKVFTIKKVPCIDLSVGNPHTFFYWLRFISFYISARFYVWFNHFGTLYSRDLYSALFFPKIILEQHSFPKKIKFPFNLIFNKKRKAVCLTSFIRDRFVKAGLSPENVIVAPSAVDLEEFNKEKLKIGIDGIKDGDFVYGYIGTLKTMGMEKGVADGLRALALLPQNFKFLIVGGEEQDVVYYKNMSTMLGVSERVVFTGKVGYAGIHSYNAKCDVLVAPFPENEHYSYFMSPLKIFEYMASRKPIIATNLPSLREVLTNGENAILIPPSSPEALAKAIITLKDDPELGKKLADNAYRDVSEKYTWKIRAKNILNFIK